MLIIPIQDLDNQTLNVVLNYQSCKIHLYVKSTGMFCDLYVNDVLLIGGVICRNLVKIVRDAYLGFSGDLVFNDTQGTSDPTSPGLGTQYNLIYLEEADL